jgi:hypothetical protein
MINIQNLKLNASSIGPRPKPLTKPTVHEPRLGERDPAPTPSVRLPNLGKRLAALAAIELAATSSAVAATGDIHNTTFRVAAAALALTVALVVAIETLAPKRRPRALATAAPAAAPVAAAPRRNALTKTRIGLLCVMAIGFATFFGAGGTFAGFTAQTTNPNSMLGSGSLLMQNTVNANPVCESKSGESNNNVNANCTPLFAFTNQEPGVYSGVSTVAIKNSGTLNASKLYMWAPYANAVLSATITSGASVTSLSLYASGHGPAGLEGTVNSGDHILVTYGGSSQTFVASAGAVPGATTISVNSLLATATFQPGATVEDLDSNTSAANTNCYDTQLVNLGFNPATNNPLCSGTVLFVQEITGGFHYCWWGSGAGSANGQCDAPISTSPASVAGGVVAAGTYTVTALTGNIKSGDTVAFTQSGNQVTCPASADYYYGATSITVGACTVQPGSVNTGFNNTAVITDTSSLTRIAGDSTHSISKFDQTTGYANKIELVPVTANGVKTPSGTDLASSTTRTFVVGATIAGSTATPPANAQNQLQQLKSTFGLVWHIDQ